VPVSGHEPQRSIQPIALLLEETVERYGRGRRFVNVRRCRVEPRCLAHLVGQLSGTADCLHNLFLRRPLDEIIGGLSPEREGLRAVAQEVAATEALERSQEQRPKIDPATLVAELVQCVTGILGSRWGVAREGEIFGNGPDETIVPVMSTFRSSLVSRSNGRTASI
jgi:hypothetical protein